MFACPSIGSKLRIFSEFSSFNPFSVLVYCFFILVLLFSFYCGFCRHCCYHYDLLVSKDRRLHAVACILISSVERHFFIYLLCFVFL